MLCWQTWDGILCHAVQCYAMPVRAMLCHAMLTWNGLDVRAYGAALLHSFTEGHHLGCRAQLYGCDEGVGLGEALRGGACIP